MSAPAKKNGSHDLAADLLADLTRPLPTAQAPRRLKPVTPRKPRAVKSPAAERGPALEGSLRITPLHWHRPSVTVSRKGATAYLGPVTTELRVS